jgi:hypothetical protein
MFKRPVIGTFSFPAEAAARQFPVLEMELQAGAAVAFS